ncbi:hypothetical protein [Staphylococcus simiae]|nr:hypothetical protein [Staphylococcus simiae]PNZ12643.1 hypothetical protein CD113_06405 [Staphylococcus simiae]SNV66930.1 Uncharacterised protein [Staphylococcus simiae]
MKHTLLRIANELNELLLYSDIEAWCQFKKKEDGIVMVDFTHFDERYRHSNKSLMIYPHYSDEEAQELYEEMKRVIAGEELINE